MVYEGLLLFGPVFGAGWLFSVLMQQRHALYLREGMQAWIFFVIGMYFVWFWSRGRQTLPMKTWRIRLIDKRGKPATPARALLRYVLCWLWFLPGLVLVAALDIRTGPLLLLIPAANAVLWALMIYLDPQRQFLHDRLAGTRLVRVPDPTVD